MEGKDEEEEEGQEGEHREVPGGTIAGGRRSHPLWNGQSKVGLPPVGGRGDQSVEMASAIILQGTLQKKKREKALLVSVAARQGSHDAASISLTPCFPDGANYQTSAYQKRYFELSPEMLVYAKERSDLRTYGGSGQGVQMFSIEDLKEVKRKKKVNLEVRIEAMHCSCMGAG